MDLDTDQQLLMSHTHTHKNKYHMPPKGSIQHYQRSILAFLDNKLIMIKSLNTTTNVQKIHGTK